MPASSWKNLRPATYNQLRNIKSAGVAELYGRAALQAGYSVFIVAYHNRDGEPRWLVRYCKRLPTRFNSQLDVIPTAADQHEAMLVNQDDIERGTW